MDRVLRSAILNSNVIDVIQDNKRPFDELMSKYRCAIMEIETKFKVLNEQYSLHMKTAISSLEPLVADRKRIRLKVPATAIEVPKLPLTRKITRVIKHGSRVKLMTNSLV